MMNKFTIEPSQCTSYEYPKHEYTQTFWEANLGGIQRELMKLLKQEKPTLNDELRCQEEKRLYLLIESVLPFLLLHKVGMSPDVLRSLVLHLLRQSGSPLGVENQFDRLFSEWMMHSQ